MDLLNTIIDLNKNNPGLFPAIIALISFTIGILVKIGNVIVNSMKKLKIINIKIPEITSEDRWQNSHGRRNTSIQNFITISFTFYNPKSKKITLGDLEILIRNKLTKQKIIKPVFEKRIQIDQEKETEFHQQFYFSNDEMEQIPDGTKNTIWLIYYIYDTFGKYKKKKKKIGINIKL